MRPSALLLVAGLVGGCTAARGSLEVAAAERSVHRAAERGASEHAVYEYTLAVRYLEKAREELGHNQFRTATELARTAADHADKAVVHVGGGGVPVAPGSSDPVDGMTTMGAATPPQGRPTDTITVQPGAPPDGVDVHEAPAGQALDVHGVGEPHEPVDVVDSTAPKPASEVVKPVPRPSPAPAPEPEPAPKSDDPWKDVPL